jgi:hypothetical protein
LVVFLVGVVESIVFFIVEELALFVLEVFCGGLEGREADGLQFGV